MAIELPDPVAQLLNFIGIPWININEDKVREFATEVRQFAQNISSTHGDATATLQKLGSGYQGEAYEALMRMWGGKTSTHIPELVDACHVLATALDGGADFIEAQKYVCLGVLGAMAAEFIADQAAAVATAGLAEAALPAIEAATEKAIQFAVQQIEQHVIGEIANKALQPLTGKIEQLVEGLVLPEGGEAGGSAGSGFKIDHEHVAAHAKLMQDHADTVSRHVGKFTANLDAMDFTS